MHIVGWISSGILVIGMIAQVVRQWREGTSKGVSVWLHVAQLAANMGFAAYGASQQDLVVMLTGSAMALCSLAGLGILIRHRRVSGRTKSSRRPKESVRHARTFRSAAG